MDDWREPCFGQRSTRVTARVASSPTGHAVHVLPRLGLTVAVLFTAGCVASPDLTRVRVTEVGSGRPVVLLHGHPQTSDSWREVVPTLAADHRVLVVDVLGPTAAGRADSVAAELRRREVRAAAVVGTDLGGHTAFALARDHPALVDRLAVLEAIVPGTRAAAGPLSAPHIARHAAHERMSERVEGREQQHVRDFVCGERSPCPHPPDLLAGAAEQLALDGEAAFAPYAELVGELPGPGRVDVPVLAVGGSAGIGDLPARSLREVADDVTGVVLPGATHWLAEEHPGQLLEVLRPFLSA